VGEYVMLAGILSSDSVILPDGESNSDGRALVPRGVPDGDGLVELGRAEVVRWGSM
jgi:hypothetical protein